jgi:hypothetical protein
MIYHDPTFESIAKAPVKSTNVEVAMQIQDPYGYFDGTVVWTSSDVLMSVQIDAVGAFLGTVTKKASVKLLGIVDTASAGDIFQVRLGMLNNDPSVYGYDNISEGFFIVDSVAYDYDSGFTTVTMYDQMWTAARTPYSTSFTYPCTVENLAEQVAAAIGVDLMVGFSSLPNSSFTIPSDLYATISNATLQTVVQEIAASTGTTARMTDTTLVFSQFSVSSENLTSNELKTLKIGNQYGPVTSVVLGRVPQNDNVALSNNSSSTNTISSINTTTNLFTITANGMADGTLVQIASDGTLPAPLQANTNYFVFTNGNANTFALTPTYEDGLAGTHKIDITTGGTGNIILSQLQTQEVQINNIQILDNDRTTLLPPLYAELLGIGWSESKSDTVGLGWHEVGDVISYTQGSTIVHSFLSEIHLTLAGSVKENLVSVIPDVETINYQTAGGILKTIYNTEIKVDKQNNDITSIVSQQQSYQNETLTNFTEVYQAIDGVTTQIQSAGGGNFIINSVGRAKEADGSLTAWVKTGTGVATSYSSAGSLAAGGVSGFAIELVGASAQIKQVIPVATTSVYSMGFRVNKALGDGSARVYLTNDITSYYVDILSGTGYDWTELKIENISPGQNFWNVIVVVTGTTTKVEITDLRVLLGETLSPWVQSHDEILNTQVALTTEGIRVSSSSNPGDYTVMTPIEFKGYSNVSGTSQPVFWLNRDTTRTQKVSVTDTVDFGTTVGGTGGIVRAVVVSTGSRPGIAFVGAIS